MPENEKNRRALATHSDCHWEVEYQVASENWRHGDQLRESILTYWTTFTTVLLGVVGAGLEFLDHIPHHYYYWICGFGCVISLLSLAMDCRENQYTVAFFRRCAQLERLAHFRGQYVMTSEIHKNKLLSRRYLMATLYCCGALVWVGVLVAIMRLP